MPDQGRSATPFGSSDSLSEDSKQPSKPGRVPSDDRCPICDHWWSQHRKQGCAAPYCSCPENEGAPGRSASTSTSEEYRVKHYGTDEEVPALVRLAPGSDKPGRWLWAENDTLATIAIYADACHAGDTGAWAYLLDAIGDLMPGTRRA